MSELAVPMPLLARVPSRRRTGASAVSPGRHVVVLCAPSRSRASAAGLALALAREAGAPAALASAVGVADAVCAVPGSPGARRAATAARSRGFAPVSSGRLVWIPDGSEAPGGEAARAAAAAAGLARAAAVASMPAALAVSFARTPALDRVLAWHDAIVVVREPALPDALLDRALASLAALRRPVVVMAPPTRVAAALAVAGVHAPLEAVEAVDRLDLGRR